MLDIFIMFMFGLFGYKMGQKQSREKWEYRRWKEEQKALRKANR